MGTIPDSPLGKATRYPDAYDASLLYPVPRAPQREALAIGEALPFAGEDRWTVWELAWLDAKRRPQAGIATLVVPAASPRIVESKSVKLYCASLNHATCASVAEVESLLRRDLSQATGGAVDVRVDSPSSWRRHARGTPDGEPVDDVVPCAWPDAPEAGVLRCTPGERREALVWHGFRSACPVTGQPDYATIRIAYAGAPIERDTLLAYLFGFRNHPGFHEHCVERIHVDIANACRPDTLSVEAWFTRRGGIDISPWRSTPGLPAPRPLATVQQ